MSKLLFYRGGGWCVLVEKVLAHPTSPPLYYMPNELSWMSSGPWSSALLLLLYILLCIYLDTKSNIFWPFFFLSFLFSLYRNNFFIFVLVTLIKQNTFRSIGKNIFILLVVHILLGNYCICYSDHICILCGMYLEGHIWLHSA